MCGGIEAREGDKIWKIYFPNPKAAIPVLLEDSDHLDWIHGPQCGWARQESIEQGNWAKYHPRRGSILRSGLWRKGARSMQRASALHTGSTYLQAMPWNAW